MGSTYSIKETSKGLFCVAGQNEAVVTSHKGRELPPLSENICQILADDLNAVSEPRKSFAYCIIASLAEAAGRSPNIDIRVYIQWDRLFRFNPGPPLIQIEYNNTEGARAYLGDLWANRPLNYAESPEDMEKEGVPLIPERTVNAMERELTEMAPAEKVAVELLYERFETFSISMCILWVGGKINDEELVEAYYAFVHGRDTDEPDVDGYVSRLRHLRAILEAYRAGDGTLP